MPKQMRRNLTLDVTLVLAFLVSLKPLVTGLALHEWLGLAILGALVVHALLHRRWITGVASRWGRNLPFRTRFYYALDTLLLLSFATLISSGLWISQAVLPLLGLAAPPSLTLTTVHRLSAWATLGLLAVKLVLHWRWFLRALAPRPQAPALTTTYTPHLNRRRLLLLGGGAACTLALVGWLRHGAALASLAPTDNRADESTPTLEPGQTDPTPVMTPAAVIDPAQVGLEAAVEGAPTPTVLPKAAPLATTPAAGAQPVARPRCPYGLVNDPYPGRCRRYVDKDGAGFCDLSESA